VTLADHLAEIAAELATRTDRGHPADYIPELAAIDPNQFGISITLADGTQHSAGDTATPFSIQSVSKVFGLAIALGRLGDQLWTRVRREPSGLAFNSILQLESEQGIPRNPFINAGAIVTTDAALGPRPPREYLAELLTFLRTAAGDEDIHIDPAVAKSETETGHRNFALAHFLKSQGNLTNSPDLVLGAYFHQCAIAMTVDQLSRAGRFLAGFQRLIAPERTRRINALMLTCGHYDGSGEFAFRVGLPGKSGVGGGILAIAPGRATIAVWSPGLNAQGNSQLGTEALELLARRTGWSIFG
jgi:glutaminase